ncbi:hypothetical protein [Kitasatospora purpeofusca]|uniref:hypothetical protein n=1 Tax=Kitasatospora purpeofusca TaxID=67352 RepID=UPI0035D76CA5
MSVHFTTFVLPKTAINLPHDTPFLVFGADTAEEITSIPLATSLHVIGNELMPLVHASETYPVPVSDHWIRASMEEYDRAAKVAVVLEPVPADISTEWAELTEGALGPDLPPWLSMMLFAKLHVVTRDVPVTSGTGVADIGMVVGAPTTLPAWAHQEIVPEGR